MAKKIDKEIADILQGVDDGSSNSSDYDSGSDSEERNYDYNDVSSSDVHSSDDEDVETNEDPSRLNQLLSATMDKSGRLLHGEGYNTRNRVGTIVRDEEKINLEDLIGTLDKQEDEDFEETRGGDNDISEVLQREEAKKHLKILADKKTMFHAMDESQIRRLEREETEKTVDSELKDWENLVENVNSFRYKPLIHADSDGPKKSKLRGLRVIDEFDKDLVEKRSIVTNEDVGVPDKLEKDSLKTKEAMIEQARKIAQKKRLIAIENAKLARLKNIKSKEFRRRLRKRKEKEEEKHREMQEMDEDEIQRKLEEEHRKLINERITLRHKAQTAWSKRAQRYTKANTSLMGALAQKFQLANELRRKQSVVNDDNEEQMMEELLDESKREEFVNQLTSVDDESKKGLFNMKFMREARESRKEETLRMLEELDGEDYASSDEENEKALQNEKPSTSSFGKLSFTASKEMSDDEEEDGPRATSFALQKSKSSTLKEVMKDSDSDSDEEEHSEFTDRSMKDESDDEDEDSEEEIALQQDDEVPAFLLQRMNKSTSSSRKKSSVKRRGVQELYDSDSSDEESGANPWLFKSQLEKKKPTKRIKKETIAYSSDESSESENDDADISYQQDVKRAAFAADDVKLEFEKEKQKAIDRSITLPDLQSDTLPGWGTDFIGEGVDWESAFIAKKELISSVEDRLKMEKAQERIDYDLDHVVIRDTARVPEEYLLQTYRHSRFEDHQLVYAQLHDRAHSIPLGPEWNSVKGFKEGVTPRIEIIPGKKIEPISKKKGEQFMKVAARAHSIQDNPLKRKRV